LDPERPGERAADDRTDEEAFKNGDGLVFRLVTGHPAAMQRLAISDTNAKSQRPFSSFFQGRWKMFDWQRSHSCTARGSLAKPRILHRDDPAWGQNQKGRIGSIDIPESVPLRNSSQPSPVLNHQDHCLSRMMMVMMIMMVVVVVTISSPCPCPLGYALAAFGRRLTLETGTWTYLQRQGFDGSIILLAVQLIPTPDTRNGRSWR
jgi:hypothetical protein